ncbi:branched-chain amino acid ABC transporter permease [Fodinisporobacter ferrooxydans]|uniref:Branched-chain amino acid ABC transporter permease n=1 Tax=Fodinisporobacter ferrooxydans TaxID=2901836 RepID=A0ABY4CHF0_9BACL|nr:branched-chain amino acid ABC transporter permease [Alicyclobacillaceae bacterium MYW30-H2]
MRLSTQVRFLQTSRLTWGVYALLFICFLFLPWIIDGYYIHILILIGVYVLLSSSLDLALGTTGLLQLGHAGFYGIGAYVGAIVSTRIFPNTWLGFWIGLPIVVVVCMIAGLVIGVPTLRLKGHYFGLATLGFGEIVYGILLNWQSVTNGSFGIKSIPSPHIGSIDLGQREYFYYLIWIVVALILWILYALRKSRFGYMWRAVREDEVAAGTMGIHVFKQKVIVLMISAGIAGIAGSFFAHYISYISPDNFTLDESILVLSMVIIGGKDSLRGVLLGSFLLVVLPEILRPVAQYRMLIYGFILAVMILYRPEGIVGKK